MKTGVYDINEETYHADPCDVPSLSRGTIKDLLNCPAKAWVNHPRLNPNYKPKERDIFDFGHAAHALFLQGIDNAVVIDAPDWKKKETRELRDAARKEGKIPLLKDKYDDIRRMVGHAQECLYSQLGITIDDGKPEVSYFWQEKETHMRARLDWIGNGLILDYKTTGTSSNPEEYTSIVASTGLDIQDAFYRRAEYMVNGQKADFIFMVQECMEPFVCSFIRLDTLFKEMGEQKVSRGIRLWEQCMKSGVWPGYSLGIQTVEPKPWALASWEMKMQTI